MNSGPPGLGPKLSLHFPALLPRLQGMKNKGVFPSRLMPTTVKSQTHISKEPDRCLPMFSGQCQELLKGSCTTVDSAVRDWPQAKCQPGKTTPGGPFLTGSFLCCSLTTAVLPALHAYSTRGSAQAPGATTCPFMRGTVVIPTLQMRRRRRGR